MRREGTTHVANTRPCFVGELWIHKLEGTLLCDLLLGLNSKSILKFSRAFHGTLTLDVTGEMLHL